MTSDDDRKAQPGRARSLGVSARLGLCAVVVSVVLCMIALQVPPALSQGSFVFTMFDVSGATQVFDTGGINDLGQFVGDYQQSTGFNRSYGFALTPGGSIATIDFFALAAPIINHPPYNLLVSGFSTTGINNAGAAVGHYSIKDAFTGRIVGVHGFVRDPAGTATTFDIPGAGGSTLAYGINDAGQIVGTYFGSDDVLHAFLWDPSGTVTVIDVPGAVFTRPAALNNTGQAVGIYGTSFGASGQHAFLRNSDGTVVTIDAPGVLFTPTGINDFGQVVGQSSPTTSLLRDSDGTFTPIVAPAASIAPVTRVTGINNLGQMVGRASNDTYDDHYFIAGQPVAQVQRIVPSIPLTPTRPFAPGLPASVAETKFKACTWLTDNLPSLARTTLVPTAAAGVLLIRPTLILPVPKPARVLGAALLVLFQSWVGVVTFQTNQICHDPFDPNFTTIYQPPSFSSPRIPAGNGIPPNVANAANAALGHLVRSASELDAVDTTLNRYVSALQRGDAASAAMQRRALTSYQRSGNEELRAYDGAARELACLIRPTFLNVEVTPAEFGGALADIRARGTSALPPLEQGIFRIVGLSPSAALLNQLAGAASSAERRAGSKDDDEEHEGEDGSACRAAAPSTDRRTVSEVLRESARLAHKLADRLEPSR